MPASYETKVKSAAIVKQKCKEYGLDEHQTKEVLKIVEFESRFDPNAKNPDPKSTASGLGQFTKATWKDYGNGKEVFDAEAIADAT
ncbi:MAG: transglycosylase SLT domain-containing protein, partial [Nanoarchaeota archaeon]